MRVALIASARYPIVQPFAGGMEAHTWALATELRRRGHDVEVFAGAGSDPNLRVRDLGRPLRLSSAASNDASMTSRHWIDEHHAYLSLMLSLAESPDRFDLIHNNSLHYLPVAMAPALPSPLVTTLHTPPTPWLESAIQASTVRQVTFVAVSEHTAAAWRPLVRHAHVVHNGVDPGSWPLGAGGDALAWAGRLVPEKGAPKAIHAARRAGRKLRLAGPVHDREYFDARIRPLLGGDVTYVGHLDDRELAHLFGSSAATMVTPCWDEPYGLVVAQSLACGTPVCGFARGALPEIVTPACGRLVPGDDVDALASVVDETTRLSRQAAHDRAVSACSHENMVTGYERLYGELVA